MKEFINGMILQVDGVLFEFEGLFWSRSNSSEACFVGKFYRFA